MHAATSRTKKTSHAATAPPARVASGRPRNATRVPAWAVGTNPATLFGVERGIQAKLTINQPGDVYEQEADRVAEQVMRMPEPQGGSKRCACGGVAGPDGECAACRAKRPGVQRRASAAPASAEAPPIVHDVLRAPGQPLDAGTRTWMESRFGHDFSGVRLHTNGRAAQSAASVGARAYTVGRNVVFGGGEYVPGTSEGQKLLAHELAHVVQQQEFRAVHLQRSPLSDEVAAAADKQNLLALLKRLSAADVQKAMQDPAQATELEAAVQKLKDPSDLLLAQRILRGKLGDTTGLKVGRKTAKPSPIQVFFIPGASTDRALVIAGVHGSEAQGVEVAEMLLKDLQAAKTAPHFNVILVPTLFPDHLAFREREFATETNRNFPLTDTAVTDYKDVADKTVEGKATTRRIAVDAAGKEIQDAKKKQRILHENVLLMELIDKFKPTRIISIHGTHTHSSAGVFSDPFFITKSEQAAIETAAGADAARDVKAAGLAEGSQEAKKKLEERTKAHVERRQKALQTTKDARTGDDEALAIASAYAISQQIPSTSTLHKRDEALKAQRSTLQTKLAGVEAREKTLAEAKSKRALTEDEKKELGKITKEKKNFRFQINILSDANIQAVEKNPATAGNVLHKGVGKEQATWSADKGKSVQDREKEGVSLGLYGPAKGISVFTVEPAVNKRSDEYATGLDPNVSEVDRKAELQAYADAIRTILLGSASGATALKARRPKPAATTPAQGETAQ